MKKSIRGVRMPRPKVPQSVHIPTTEVIKKNVDYRAVKLRRLY